MKVVAVKAPITIKNVGLNGVQSLARERIRREIKLMGGPGIMGKIQPMSPIMARMSPRIIRVVVKIFSFL